VTWNAKHENNGGPRFGAGNDSPTSVGGFFGGAPENYIVDATFGQILSDVGPRILQFALKYTF